MSASDRRSAFRAESTSSGPAAASCTRRRSAEACECVMADYYGILRKAVDGFERNDAQARRELYERARRTVLTRQPLLPPDEVERHLEGLHEAAERIEAEFADASASPAPPAPARRIGLAA